MIRKGRSYHLFFLLSSVLLFSLITGCGKDVYERDISSDIQVAFVREGNNTILVAETVDDYPCSGYTIESSHSIFYRSMNIRFKYIKETDGCLTATGPATKVLDLGILNRAFYDVTFKVNGNEVTGRLDAESLELSLPDGEQVKAF